MAEKNDNKQDEFALNSKGMLNKKEYLCGLPKLTHRRHEIILKSLSNGESVMIPYYIIPPNNPNEIRSYVLMHLKITEPKSFDDMFNDFESIRNQYKQ